MCNCTVLTQLSTTNDAFGSGYLIDPLLLSISDRESTRYHSPLYRYRHASRCPLHASPSRGALCLRDAICPLVACFFFTGSTLHLLHDCDHRLATAADDPETLRRSAGRRITDPDCKLHPPIPRVAVEPSKDCGPSHRHHRGSTTHIHIHPPPFADVESPRAARKHYSVHAAFEQTESAPSQRCARPPAAV
jgi:hypothetical protein